jgi:hypothetical protein
VRRSVLEIGWDISDAKYLDPAGVTESSLFHVAARRTVSGINLTAIGGLIEMEDGKPAG